MALPPPSERKKKKIHLSERICCSLPTGFITSPIYLSHETGDWHPETPGRLLAIHDYIKKTGIASFLRFVTPIPHPEISEWITSIHHPGYYQSLHHKIPTQGLSNLDPDTPISPLSVTAAEMAVSGVLTAIDEVMAGRLQNAFCAIRPPGHHAELNRAMGFCLFNNVAIGARYLQKQYGLTRIFIIDWDVHHGNGTQNSFYADPTVFYFSAHQYPFYPGTGSVKERGVDYGEGFTVNCPLPAGAGDRKFLNLFNKTLANAVAGFKPDFILISAGFDAHRDDPLANLQVTDEGFSEITTIVKGLAGTYCGGRIVSCLEGGYDLSALASAVGKHLTVLAGM
ncbi:MAG: histone deacetylase [Nitrospirae bacterium]|nr:histone deacetylase [Candidatus Troglogloeales bacterium]